MKSFPIPSLVFAVLAAPALAGDPAPIEPAQQRQLVVLHEEERMARDIYLKLGERYPLNPFRNIPRSEEQHMRVTAELLEHHGIPVPAEGRPGRFVTPELQRLYDKLVKRGAKSEIDALRVGALVEETDIRDLRAMAKDPPSKFAKQIAEQLEQASYNHLRAFVRNLSARGADVVSVTGAVPGKAAAEDLNSPRQVTPQQTFPTPPGT